MRIKAGQDIFPGAHHGLVANVTDAAIKLPVIAAANGTLPDRLVDVLRGVGSGLQSGQGAAPGGLVGMLGRGTLLSSSEGVQAALRLTSVLEEASRKRGLTIEPLAMLLVVTMVVAALACVVLQSFGGKAQEPLEVEPGETEKQEVHIRKPSQSSLPSGMSLGSTPWRGSPTESGVTAGTLGLPRNLVRGQATGTTYQPIDASFASGAALLPPQPAAPDASLDSFNPMLPMKTQGGGTRLAGEVFAGANRELRQKMQKRHTVPAPQGEAMRTSSMVTTQSIPE